MSKVKMPEPSLWVKTRISNGETSFCDEGPVKHVNLFLWEPGYITANQAEAYKDACVREALEMAIVHVSRSIDRYQAEHQIRALIPDM